MPKVSDATINELQAKKPTSGGSLKGGANAFLWDDALEGYGVAAYPSGKKSFVIQFRQNGRSRRMTIGKCSVLTPTDARREAKKLLGKIAGGEDPLRARRDSRAVRTFKELALDCLAQDIEKRCKASTAKQYRKSLENHVFPALGSRLLNDLKRKDIAAIHTKLSKTPVAANRCLAVVSRVWNWAAKHDEVAADANPAKRLSRYGETSKERFLTTEETTRLGEVLRLAETEGLPWDISSNSKHIPKTNRFRVIDPYAIAAIRLLLLTGARRNEIVSAKWDWVDWQRGILFLRDSKTGKKPIYLSAPALTLLESLNRVPGNPYIVPGKQKKNGAPSHRYDLKKPWAAISKAAGLKDAADLENVRLHDLRHSFASAGAGASLGLPIIGKLLGHARPATTARYAHLETDPIHRAGNIIGNQIAAALAGKTAEVIGLATGRKASA